MSPAKTVSESKIVKADRPFDSSGQPDTQLYKYIFSHIEENLNTKGDTVYLTDYATKKQIRYSELIPMVNRVANGITKRGFKPGDMICMYANNHVEFLIVLLAAWRCGGGITTLRTLCVPEEIANQCKLTGSRFICTDTKRAQRALEGARLCPTVKEIWCLNGNVEGMVSVSDFFAEESSDFPEIEVDMDETVAWIVFSSGSTGAPKGVVYTHRGVLSIAYIYEFATLVPLHFVIFYVFVFAQIAGLSLVLSTMLKRVATVTVSDYDEDDIPAIVADIKPSLVAVFPHHVITFTRRPEVRKYDFSSVFAFAFTGSAWNALDERLLFEVFPNLQMFNVNYGMSEVGLVSSRYVTKAQVFAEGYVPCCSGSVELGAELKIVQNGTGELLGPNEEGEIYVKTSRMMQRYLNSPKLTEEFFKDGWARTGDIGYYTESGDLFVTGRTKDLIKYRMTHVAPLLIENLIGCLDYVDVACVIGIPHEIDGEHPAAAVVLKPGCTAKPEDIANYVAENMNDINQLRGGVYFLPSIPRDSVGKMVKREVLKTVIEMSGKKQ